MKIALLVDGTRGDVQPMVAFAHALNARGHDAWLGAPLDARAFVERTGVRYLPIGTDARAFLESDEGRRILARGDLRSFVAELGAQRRNLRDVLDRDVRAACAGADVIVSSALTLDRAQSIAEAQRATLIGVLMCPLWPTGEFPSPPVTARRLPLRALNRATHHLFNALWWRGVRDDTNGLRAELGLPSVRASTFARCGAAGVPMLHPYGHALVPRPRDWSDAHTTVGFLHFPAALRERLGEAAAPDGLSDWIESGSPPLYLGFGSMPVTDPAATLSMLAEVTSELGRRAVVVAGWSSIPSVAAQHHPHLFVAGAVDHEWLLPRCAAAVHHGGAGTTASVLRAGLPAVVASIFADQPFWGTRVERLGAGLHVPFHRLDRARLTGALREVLRSDEMRRRASSIAVRLREEGDGVTDAVRLVERLGGASA